MRDTQCRLHIIPNSFNYAKFSPTIPGFVIICWIIIWPCLQLRFDIIYKSSCDPAWFRWFLVVVIKWWMKVRRSLPMLSVLDVLVKSLANFAFAVASDLMSTKDFILTLRISNVTKSFVTISNVDRDSAPSGSFHFPISISFRLGLTWAFRIVFRAFTTLLSRAVATSLTSCRLSFQAIPTFPHRLESESDRIKGVQRRSNCSTQLDRNDSNKKDIHAQLFEKPKKTSKRRLPPQRGVNKSVKAHHGNFCWSNVQKNVATKMTIKIFIYIIVESSTWSLFISNFANLPHQHSNPPLQHARVSSFRMKLKWTKTNSDDTLWNMTTNAKDCWKSFRLGVDGAIDFVQSRDGRKKIRKVLAPIMMCGSIMMLITGATWAKFLFPECGTSLQTAKFTLSTDADTGERILSGNSCPGYNWKTGKTALTAGEYRFSYAVSATPKLSRNPIFVASSNPIPGPIGVALNGVPIYSAAGPGNKNLAASESHLLDACGGTNAPPRDFAFSAPITGYYHYRTMPGKATPSSHLCPEVAAWYNQSKGHHSPLVGFMADGVPIYGPLGAKGVAPTNLDICGGHSSDMPFYHYHFRSEFPYSVNCLKGCADGSMNKQINSGKCAVNTSTTATNNYATLEGTKVVYGGEGINSTNGTGPACLLSFGFLIFIPSTLCCFCISCGKQVSEMHDKQALADDEDLPEDDDNIL